MLRVVSMVAELIFDLHQDDRTALVEEEGIDHLCKRGEVDFDLFLVSLVR